MLVFAATLLLAAAEPASAQPHVYSESRQGFGSRVQIQVWTSDEAAAKKAAQAAFAELDRLEALVSEWRRDSDISKLNQNAGKGPRPIGPDAMAILQRGKEINAQTGGAFALTWAALGMLWDFSPGHKMTAVPDENKIRERLQSIDDNRLVLDAGKSTAELPEGFTVGIGAIAEGYGLQKLLATLQQNGVNDALVFIGGDIATIGKKGDKPWLVGLQDPRGNGYFATLPSDGEAVCTSGDYEKFFEVGTQRYSHILDPRTGYPVKGMHAATVIAKDPMTADALATSLMVLGPEAGMKLIEATPGVNAVLIDAADNIIVSSGIKQRLRVLKQPGK